MWNVLAKKKAAHKEENAASLSSYYRIHARIYDLTRWSFLFGRKRLVSLLPVNSGSSKTQTVLEVGCGTGYNLLHIARQYPQIWLVGIDLSADMLAVAQRQLTPFANRVTLLHQPFDARTDVQPDVVVAAYALTMFNPGWEAAIEDAYALLPTGGYFCLVDFHQSRFGWFERWMGMNHVRMDGHLLPVLKNRFHTIESDVVKAYGGLWEYVLFVGQK
jgi:S-adenosylmethionine-diacylgycerolhomoserine-N-methlytransferase